MTIKTHFNLFFFLGTQLKYCHKMIRVLLYRPRNNLKNTIQPKIPIHCQLHSPYHLPISPNALSSDCPCTHAIVPENECFSFQTSKLQAQHSKVQAKDETGTWIKQQMLCKQSMDSFSDMDNFSARTSHMLLHICILRIISWCLCPWTYTGHINHQYTL